MGSPHFFFPQKCPRLWGKVGLLATNEQSLSHPTLLSHEVWHMLGAKCVCAGETQGRDE